MTEDTPARRVTAFLADNDVPCPSCGYSLRGCASDRCPECGNKLKLELVSGRPTVSAWWLLALFGIAGSLVLTIWLFTPSLANIRNVIENPSLSDLVVAGYVPRSELPQWGPISGLLILTLAELGALAWLIAARRSFARLAPVSQALIAVASALSSAAVVGLSILIARIS